MKKLLFLGLLFLTVAVSRGQTQRDRIDTLTFRSGGAVTGDTLRWFNLQGKYQSIYLIVQDTGATYTDSIKCWNTSKRLSLTDSVTTQITLRNVSAGLYTDYPASSVANANTRYLLVDGYIDRLLITLSNLQFVTGRRVKITLVMITRGG